LNAKSRAIVFDHQFREDLRWWYKTDKKIAFRLLDLVESVTADPFTGIGKPEPIKYLEANTWSRRITTEHRLVYRVKDDSTISLYLNSLCIPENGFLKETRFLLKETRFLSSNGA